MAKDNTGAKDARNAAAAARAEAKATEQARDRKVRIIGGLVVLVVMGGLLAIPLIAGKNKGPDTNASAAVPTGVTKDTYGVKIGSAWSTPNADKIPLLQIWEDFQCPACAQLEVNSGEAINKLVDDGAVRLELRPTIFLDDKLSGQNMAAGNPDSSKVTTMAFGCAVDAGKGKDFHRTVFANQPKTEGDGFSIGLLTQVAQSTGITGTALTTFNECLASKKYEGWVNNSYDRFSKEGVTSTPSGILNGKELTGEELFTPETLTKLVLAAGKSSK